MIEQTTGHCVLRTPSRGVWFILVGGLCAALLGCGRSFSSGTWHERHHWQAEDFFTDPQVIQLCEAILANDLEAIDELVAAGADVNSVGQGGMTPLLWAFFDGPQPRFERLLEHGADPNVVFISDFGTNKYILEGGTVTTMTAKSGFPGYFEAVMAHGGDPNALDPLGPRTLFDLVLTTRSAQWEERLDLLLESNADINKMSFGRTPAMQAAAQGHYDVALKFLKLGADPWRRSPGSQNTITDLLRIQESRPSRPMSEQMKHDFMVLVDWLEENGPSMKASREARLKRLKLIEGSGAPEAEERRRQEFDRLERLLAVEAKTEMGQVEHTARPK